MNEPTYFVHIYLPLLCVSYGAHLHDHAVRPKEPGRQGYRGGKSAEPAPGVGSSVLGMFQTLVF